MPKTSFWAAGLVLPAIMASAAYADDATCHSSEEDISINGTSVERDYNTVCNDSNGWAEVSEAVPTGNDSEDVFIVDEAPVLVSEWVEVTPVHQHQQETSQTQTK